MVSVELLSSVFLCSFESKWNGSCPLAVQRAETNKELSLCPSNLSHG